MEDGEDADGTQRVPLSRMRRAIAATMTLSAQIPQFTLERTARLNALVERREQLRARGSAASLSDVLSAACARALRAHPTVNVSFDDDAILLHEEINIGLAVALEDGLVSPAITAADRRTLPELATERRRLTAAARDGKLRGVELTGATFSISNLGPFGIERFRALVIPPQAAILAVGAQLGSSTRPTLGLSLSCDHRVVDGAPGAEFLGRIVGELEQPDWLDDLVDERKP